MTGVSGVYVGRHGKSVTYGNARSHLSIIVIALLVFFAVAGFLIMNSHDRARDDLIEALKAEREASAVNGKLKTELAAVTRTRLLELKAKERLGLKKPTEEEVLVLR